MAKRGIETRTFDDYEPYTFDNGQYVAEPEFSYIGSEPPDLLNEPDTMVIHSMYVPEERKLGREESFDPTDCRNLLEECGASCHFLVPRGEMTEGGDYVVYQMVETDRKAYHAGKSRMPPPDGREWVNDFSIGVELIGKEEEGFGDEQYEALVGLVVQIMDRFPIENIVGHSDVSGKEVRPDEAKTDPGNRFNWARFLNMLAGAVGEERFDKLEMVGANRSGPGRRLTREVATRVGRKLGRYSEDRVTQSGIEKIHEALGKSKSVLVLIDHKLGPKQKLFGVIEVDSGRVEPEAIGFLLGEFEAQRYVVPVAAYLWANQAIRWGLFWPVQALPGVELYPVVREKDKAKGVKIDEAVNRDYGKVAIGAAKQGESLLLIAAGAERADPDVPVEVDSGVMSVILNSRAVVCMSSSLAESGKHVVKVSDRMWNGAELRRQKGTRVARQEVGELVAREMERLRALEWK